MRLTIKLNLNTLISTTFTNQFYLAFDDIIDMENWCDSDEQPNVTGLEFQQALTEKIMYVFLNGATNPDYDKRDGYIEDLSDSTYIKFTCTINDSSYAIVQDFISKGIIEVDQNNKTSLFAYRLNSEKDKVTKTLTFVTAFEGTFKAPLGIKNIELDVINYDIENSYNYVYIPKLKRYYYVINIVLNTKDYTRIQLQEDVLMSHKELILLQDALVTRYQDSSQATPYSNLVDDRLPFKDVNEVSYITPTNVTGANVVQFKYVMDTVSGQTYKKPNIFVSTVANFLGAITPSDSDNIVAPTGSGLPNIQSKRGSFSHNFLLNIDTYNRMIYACINDDNPASFIRSILLMPFDLTTVFTDAIKNYRIYAGDKVLDGTGWVNPVDVSQSAPVTWETKKGSSPYILVKDFYFGTAGGITFKNDWRDYDPYTQWEIYIPFVGWVKLDFLQVKNKRIQIYFTFDLDTGNSTCVIYNYSNEKVIWSANCQIGIRLPLAMSNALENARTKDANALNTIMGLMTSALAMGVGAYSLNPVAVMGGVMGIGKTLTSAVNKNNMIFERGQISYGSSDNALYSPNEIVIRKTERSVLFDTFSTNFTKYRHINGLPYNNYVTLSTLTPNNYIEVGVIHFDAKGYNIYTSEIDEIVALLKNGVII